MMELHRIVRMIDLLTEYGKAKFGDEWWPGNAKPYLGKKKGAELEKLLNEFDSDDAIRPVID